MRLSITYRLSVQKRERELLGVQYTHYILHICTCICSCMYIFPQGNHEYYTMDAGNWLTHLDSLGINVLHNGNRQIPSEGNPKEQLCMAGVDDLEADRIM